MQAGMVEGQFATLDPPAADETDVAVVDATATLAQVVARAEAALEGMRPGTGVVPLVAEVVRTELLGNGARRVLLVLPDITRSHSGAGHITGAVFSQLSAAGCSVAVREAIAHDRDLARNLGAAAHLVHGSSEGRFRIVYCTDPTSGGLSRKEVEGVGYEWRPVGTELERLGVDGSGSTGPRTDCGGRPFHHIAQPGLGLWTSRPIEG
jgi:hypothetical protein